MRSHRPHALVVEPTVERPDVLGGPVHVLVGRDVLVSVPSWSTGLRGVYTLAAAPPPGDPPPS
jgi:hypothetical protein